MNIEIDWKNLFEKMAMGFAVHRIVWDKKGEAVDIKYLSVNKAFEKLTGISGAKVVGKNTSEVMPGLEKEWLKKYGDVVKNNKPISFVQKASPLNKTFFVYAFKTGEDEFASVFLDETKKNEAKSLVSDSEAKYQAIVDGSQDAIVMMDDRGLITSWNISAEKMFGYKESEVAGKDLHDLITVVKEHRENKEHLGVFFKTGKSPVLGKIIELPVKRKNGEKFTIELTVSSTKLGERWFGIGVMRDVTERIKSELELKERTESLEMMNKLMVDREIKMIELKKELAEIKGKIKHA